MLWAIFGGLLSLALIGRCVYNLYFHPLRRFPGPKKAAIGAFLEFYYEVVKDGTYIWEIEKMHRKYGPIVRINADELHISDPEFYGTIYAGGGRRINKDEATVAAYTVPRASIATVDHDRHRVRRAMLNPYFSRKAITNLEPLIHERIDSLFEKLDDYHAQGTVVDLEKAFSALTGDVITAYFYGSHGDHLSSENFKNEEKDAAVGVIKMYHLARFLPTLANWMKKLPIPIVRMIHPGAAHMLQSQIDVRKVITESMKTKKQTPRSRSVIVSALTDPNNPAEENTIERLVDEGMTIILAGTETTAHTLAATMFYVLNDKKILARLRDELAALAPGPPEKYTYSGLESLPYLTAVINEGLRLSHGVSARLPRISVVEPLHYGDWVIPPRTPVSSHSPLIHYNPTIFPNPKAFDPTRWIKATDAGVNLTKYIASFTKGSRGCLGIPLAYCEMYLLLARLVSRFDLTLDGTTVEDVEPYHIRLTSYPREGMGEVRVRIERRA
ncbi:cytochrome P450 [Podospora aff. communis PSN243]|uniref:Cytochrome P450 n=1 Tax=Podospora aff. communis PSN243 TaxID=3040156 RepID=A0AAV9G4P1_9PEZI|nr:cytochrome P450 [Podospora aff. communis PSN243]